MEAVFAQARDAEAVAEELLVDEGCKAVEPTVVETHRNGNGHAANGVEPSVELVMGNGRHANGHHEEAAEGQQSLFSWAEFMAEEPVKPKGRKPKSQSATISMFEWALTVEREREKEVVGAGRSTAKTLGWPSFEDGGHPCLAICAGFFLLLGMPLQSTDRRQVTPYQ